MYTQNLPGHLSSIYEPDRVKVALALRASKN